MKKDREHILFLCNTYMQLVTALQIKRKLFPDASVDLLLSDHSINAKKVVSQLEKIHIFDRVKDVSTKFYLFQQSKLQDILDIVRLSLNVGNKYRAILFSEDCLYDKIFYFNFDLLLYAVIDVCHNQNKMPMLCRFEEGIHSYQNMILEEKCTEGTRLQIINKIRGLFHRQCIFETTKDFYVFFDNLFPKYAGRVHGIPKLSREDKELVETLNKCFEYQPEKDVYEEKYIFFGSSREVDGFNTEETSIIFKFAESVGKNNLLVKMHPRDGRSIYEKQGIKVSKISSIPWEVIQMNHDFSNHVFITMASGSVICGSALLGDQIPTYLLYPIDKGKDKTYDIFCEEAIKGLITKLQKQGMCLQHRIVEKIEEIR